MRRVFWDKADEIVRSTRSPDQLLNHGLVALAAEAAARLQATMAAKFGTASSS
jgi:hypothetical protein